MSETPPLRVEGGGDALRAAIRAAPENARIEIGAGRYEGPLVLRRSLTLVGDGGVCIDGGTLGAVLTIEGRRNRIVLEGLELVGGRARAGGAVLVADGAWLTLRDCLISGCQAAARGGGGLWARRGELLLQRVRLANNGGAHGGAVLLNGDAKARFEACTFDGNSATVAGGAVAVRDRAGAVLQDCVFIGNRVADATGGRGSAVHVQPSARGPGPVVMQGGSVDGEAEAVWGLQGHETTP